MYTMPTPYGYALHGGSVATVIFEPLGATEHAIIVCEDFYGPGMVRVSQHSLGLTFPTVAALDAFYDSLDESDDSLEAVVSTGTLAP